MEDIGVIHLDSGRLFKIRLSELERWLPKIHHLVHFNRFDARGLVRQMTGIFNGQVYRTITAETIITVLDDFMTQLELNPLFAPPIGKTLQRSIELRLRKDLSVANTAGLRRSREHFMVFCLLARLSRSQALAESMASFLCCFVWEVVHGEEPELFREWCMGIVELRDLIPHQILEGLLRCFFGFVDRAYEPRLLPAYYDRHAKTIMRYMLQAQHHSLLNHPRRRAPLILEDPAGYLRDRLLCVGRPRQHYRYHRQLQLTYPWAQPNGRFDEVEKMQYQQEEMNMRIDHIDRKLDYLI